MSLGMESIKEIVEHKWQIPNFLSIISAVRSHEKTTLEAFCRFPFLVGVKEGGKPKGICDSLIRAEASLAFNDSWVWVDFRLLDRPFHPSWTITVNGEFIRIIQNDQNTTVIRDVTRICKKTNWSAVEHECPVFLGSEAEQLVDADGSLNIHFQLQVNIVRPTASQALANHLESCGNEMQRDLEEFRKDSKLADFDIKVIGKGEVKSFKCHKVILAARSSLFREMFKNEQAKEFKESVFEVADISPQAMHHFLAFLYSGRFEHSSWKKSLLQLVYAAEKYQVKSLKTLCDSHLIEIVTCDNAVALGRIAERHGLSKAVRDIKTFTAKNMAEITFDSYEESGDDE